ncbi:MAG: hypothetical protein V4594_20975 [Bacteroidota bacterium]
MGEAQKEEDKLCTTTVRKILLSLKFSILTEYNEFKMYEKSDLRIVLQGKPFCIYPREVEPDLDIYTLIAMAAAHVRADPELSDVFQFVFIIKGGLQSRLLQIGAKNTSISEVDAGLKQWTNIINNRRMDIN